MPYESGRSTSQASTKSTRSAAVRGAEANPFLQFTDRSRFEQLRNQAGTKAGPARAVSPLTIAARLQHLQRQISNPEGILDEDLDEEC
jgi:hypothetical protein